MVKWAIKQCSGCIVKAQDKWKGENLMIKNETGAIHMIAIIAICNISMMTSNCMMKRSASVPILKSEYNVKDEAECQRLAHILETYFALTQSEWESLKDRIAHNQGVCDATGIEADVFNHLKGESPEKKAIVFFNTPLEDFTSTGGQYKGVYTRGLNLCYLRAIGDVSSSKEINELGMLKNFLHLCSSRDVLRRCCAGSLDLDSGFFKKIENEGYDQVKKFIKSLRQIKVIFNECNFLSKKEYYGETDDGRIANTLIKLRTILSELDLMELVNWPLEDDNLGWRDGDRMDFMMLCRDLRDVKIRLSSLESLPDGLSQYTLVPAYVNYSGGANGKIALFYNRGFDDKDSPFPQRAWTVFNGDKTLFQVGRNDPNLYKSMGEKTKDKDHARVDGEYECRLQSLPQLSPEDWSISHHILVDGPHAERLIPLKYYERIKEILRQKGVMIIEVGTVRYPG
jgi:hypothetical protein